MGRVQDKAALITGGAAGLGEAAAELLSREGAKVVITDIDEDKGEQTAKRLGCVFMKHDVSSEADWQRVIAATIVELGGLNVLVNNAGTAGGSEPADPEHTTLESWTRITTVNLNGVFLGCKHAIPAMRDSGGGAIINLSSVAALVATPFLTAYGASKAGVMQLTKSVALYCAQNGDKIRCNSVHPGQIATPMLQGLWSRISEEAGISTEEARAAFLAKIPIGEFAEAEDIAAAVLYLASEESKHVTGTQLVVDGGMTLNP